MTRPPISPSGPGPASTAWLARTVVTGVCAIGAFVLGLVLGLFGLVGVATVLAVVFVAIAAGPWRRAALPLAAVAAALSLGGLLATRSDGRISPSIGNRIEVIEPGELSSGTASFRRGYGSITIDLRNAELRPGTTTRLRARSDVGGVVVALDRKVCTRVNLRFRQLEVNPVAEQLGLWTQSAGIRQLTEVPGSASFLPDLFSPGHPDGFSGSSNVMVSSIAGRYSGGPSSWFGQTLSRVVEPERVQGGYEYSLNARSGSEYRLTRGVARPDAAVIDLDIQSGGGFVVRDYPSGVDVQPSVDAPELDWPDAWTGPRDYATPPEPNGSYDAARSDRKVRARWAAWERAWVRAGKRRAVLAAGTCATRDALRDHWETSGVAYDDMGVARLSLAVNGLGELVVSTKKGFRPASDSAAALARATGTTAISTAVQQERLKTYRAANLPEAR